jgi:hypothetical protein|tara:strand:- start:283 stop:570 length:288 start_codon:yes stop_codon:yes gene_type:complete
MTVTWRIRALVICKKSFRTEWRKIFTSINYAKIDLNKNYKYTADLDVLFYDIKLNECVEHVKNWNPDEGKLILGATGRGSWHYIYELRKQKEISE